jgi:uncharacterized protein YciI
MRRFSVKQYAYLVRPAFDQVFMASAGERETAVVAEHWEFLLDLNRRGSLVFAGRCFDGPFGIIVFEAADDEEAAAITGSDPSVVAGVQQAELHPFKVGLLRGEEPS